MEASRATAGAEIIAQLRKELRGQRLFVSPLPDGKALCRACRAMMPSLGYDTCLRCSVPPKPDEKKSDYWQRVRERFNP